MKILNIILGILTLLLVLACAAGAFFLLEKQDHLRTGWTIMTGAISDSSTALDGGDTKFAAELSKEKLSFSNLGELDNNLKKFHSQIDGVLKQRQKLAKSLHGIALKVGMNNPPSEKTLVSAASCAAAAGSIAAAVSSAEATRNRSFANIASAIKNAYGVSVDNAKLAAGDPSAFDAVNNSITAEVQRRYAYEKALGASALAARISGVNFSGDPQTAATRFNSGIDAAKNNYNRVGSELRNQESLRTRQKQQIAANTAKIKSLDDTVAANAADTVKFKQELSLPVDQDVPAIWQAGSAEAKKALVGKVIRVNNKYGYIALDIGQNTTVGQQFGNRSIQINPRIKSGERLNVARGDVNGESQLITQIELDEVGPLYSTANIPEGSAPIEVGDFVYIVQK